MKGFAPFIINTRKEGVVMGTEKKAFVAPKYTVVRFDSRIVMLDSSECIEMHSWQSGTDCHEQEMYLQQGD